MSSNDASEASDGGPPSAFDVIVLGAGISGLVSASMLQEQGHHRVLVVDEYGHVGGNHIDRSHGGYTFDVGSFIFQDDSPLLRHLPELLPLYVPIDPSWARLNPQGMITRYPFSVRDDLVAAGPLECLRILLSAGVARLFHRRLGNARDFARHWIGARLLHRSGLEHYMERFCGLPAEQIDLKFAEKRMLWIAERASLATLLRSIRPAGPADAPTNRQLARPREGFSYLYRGVRQRLENGGAKFVLNADLRSLQGSSGNFRLQLGENVFHAPRVISTIPIDRVKQLCGVPLGKQLPTVTLISLFFSFAGDRGFTESILYNFSHDGAWKRLTMYSEFYGRHRGREFFAVEVLADRVQNSVDRAERDFCTHVAANGLFTGDLRLEGSHVLAHAYPIYTGQAGDRAEDTVATLRALGIESFGRQGGFQYQPTARVSTQEAEAALQDLSVTLPVR